MSVKRPECAGCRDDYYNHREENGCWLRNDATFVERTKVGVWWNPPYTWRPQRVLSCHRPEGMVWLSKDDCRFKHNWRDETEGK